MQSPVFKNSDKDQAGNNNNNLLHGYIEHVPKLSKDSQKKGDDIFRAKTSKLDIGICNRNHHHQYHLNQSPPSLVQQYPQKNVNVRNLPNKISSSAISSQSNIVVDQQAATAVASALSQDNQLAIIIGGKTGGIETGGKINNKFIAAAYTDTYKVQKTGNSSSSSNTSNNLNNKISQNFSRSHLTNINKLSGASAAQIIAMKDGSAASIKAQLASQHTMIDNSENRDSSSNATHQYHQGDSEAVPDGESVFEPSNSNDSYSNKNNTIEKEQQHQGKTASQQLHPQHNHINISVGQDSERHSIQRESMIKQATTNGFSNVSNQSHHHQEKRRNLDYKISKTSERSIIKKKQQQQSSPTSSSIIIQGGNTKVDLQTVDAKHTKKQPFLHQQQNRDLRHQQQKSQHEAVMIGDQKNKQQMVQQLNKSKDTDQMSISTRGGGCDDSLIDFIGPNKNLNGRIGGYKINFNKNLRRFQDIASEQALKEPKLAELSNNFMQETLLPSIWSFSQLGQSSKFLKQIQSNSMKHSDGQTSLTNPMQQPPDLGQQNSEPIQQHTLTFYELNSSVLPLQINFNPLLITYCLFLRALAELANQGNEKSIDSEKVTEYCLVQHKKIISKLYQIQIKAVNHALQNLNLEGVSTEGLPAKVIEFIKKWVSKEKVLISHCVKQLVNPEVIASTTKQGINVDETQVYVTKDLVARKNRDQYASRVKNLDNRPQHMGRVGAGFQNLNSSKESDQFVDGSYIARVAIDQGGMTQDNFYKAVVPITTDADSPWKPGDHSLSHPNNLLVIDNKIQPSSMNLQQKVNSRHREAQHRNLFVEYHQMNSLQKQNIFKEPSMALSSTNFNKNHSNSLMQIKVQQQQNLNQKTQGRQGLVSDVYGDWKQNQTTSSTNNNNNKVRHKVSGVGKRGNTTTASDIQHSSQKELINGNNGCSQQDFSHRASINRSFSPNQFQPNAQQNIHEQFLNQQITDFVDDEQQQSSSNHTLLPLADSQNKIGNQGAQTVTSGFFNPHKLHQHHQEQTNHNINLRNVSNKSELGYQNLQNFQWPRNTVTATAERPGSRGSAFRPQTRDSYYEHGSRQKKDSQSLAMLTGNSGMMRSTAGPTGFNLGGREKKGTSGVRQGQIPINMMQAVQMIERPSTRHGSDERSPNLTRPITQGIGRRSTGLVQINPVKPNDTIKLKANRQQPQPVDKSYTNMNNNGISGGKDVFKRRTSSRGMNRIYGGGNSSTSVHKIDSNKASKQNEQQQLKSIKSLPDGFDPIFNNSSSTYLNENSQIKIKPMKLSKGFESGNDISKHANEIFENTQASSISIVSNKGNSDNNNNISSSTLGTQDNQDDTQRTEDKKIHYQKAGVPAQISPIISKEKTNSDEKIKRKRNSNKGLQVISSSSSQSSNINAQNGGNFRKKITSKNNRETATAMESIQEEDEHLLVAAHQPGSSLRKDDLKTQLLSKKTSIQRKKDGSNGSTTMSSINQFQLTMKNGENNNNVELSTMQTSGGFSNTRRSPRDPSFEKDNGLGGGHQQSQQQIRLRPQLHSQNGNQYNSLHQLRPIDKNSNDSGSSLRPIAAAASYEFNHIIEEEEFAYQDEKEGSYHNQYQNSLHQPQSKNNKRKLLEVIQQQQQQNQQKIELHQPQQQMVKQQQSSQLSMMRQVQLSPTASASLRGSTGAQQQQQQQYRL